MRNRVSGIYVIRCSASGNCYVGSTSNFAHRWNVHRSTLRNGKHHSVVLQRAWLKYGEGSFSARIIEVCEPTQETLIEREQFWLDLIKPTYNCSMTARVSLGAVFSEERRANMRRAHASNGPKADQWRENIRAAKIGRIRGPNSVRRKPVSDETRAKMSAAKMGKKCAPHTPEHNAKISAARRARLNAVT